MFGFARPGVSVFELVNERLCEIYIGRMSAMASVRASAARPKPVPQLARWHPGDVLPPREIACDLSEREAERFIAAYVQKPLPKGWRFLNEPR